MKIGRIKKLCMDRHPPFGFIAPDGGGMDVYFNVDCYHGDIPFTDLKVGDRLHYVDAVRQINNELKVRATFVQYKKEDS